MTHRLIIASLSAAAAAALSGCAASSGDSAATAMTGSNSEQTELIVEQRTRIDSLESELRNRDLELEIARTAPAKETAVGPGQLFPPDAKPGRCYARVLTPGQYKEDTESVLLRQASERVEIIPARYETVDERVLVREASTRLEIIPARYETKEERVLVQPESTVIEEIPATYKTVSEQVLVSPARTEWKRGSAASFLGTGNVVQSRTTDTGEIMCLVEVPAQYRTVNQTVVDQPARTREIKVPAQYNTIKKTVLVEPAKTREIKVPAEYGKVKVTKLVSPAKQRRIDIPAEYGTVNKRSKVSEDQLEWRQVLCDVNMTSDNVRKLQATLNDRGYNAGPVDGKIGALTLNGANAFAKANGLPAGSNYIAIEVADKLGLKY
ncbi:MAG: peptidoglycan-binding protein [Gammaproteobacteria bacterium]|nr:peptidoglycan-binding protein [Gammaproteobacteria bacterium]